MARNVHDVLGQRIVDELVVGGRHRLQAVLDHVVAVGALGQLNHLVPQLLLDDPAQPNRCERNLL